MANAFRDRELDNELKRVSENACAQQAQRPKPVPFLHAQAELGDAFAAILANDGSATKERIDAAITKALTPYYLGRGSFKLKQFVQDLETLKGSKLNAREQAQFGATAGEWVSQRFFAELEKEVVSKNLQGVDAVLFFITESTAFLQRTNADAREADPTFTISN